MELLATVLPRLISMLLSWLDSANLRDRMYRQQQQIEILVTALDDIERINAGENQLIAGICQRSRRP
jgi:hypothetical protein